MIDRTDPNFLLSTMDANEWATEFCKRFPSMDHGTMLGWFANSIMTGYDEANRRAVPQANAEQPLVEKLSMSMVASVDYLKGWNDCVDAIAAEVSKGSEHPANNERQS